MRMLLGAVGLATTIACAPGGEAAVGAHDSTEGASVLTTIERAQEPVAYAVSSEPFVEGRRLVEAVPSRAVPAFQVLARESELARAPCTRCHTVPLASMRWDGADGRRRAHWDVDLTHASENVMQCATCHAVDDGGALTLLGGQSVGFDHAYQTCAQCHTGQAADWAGGAHGKRAGGWAPPRVVFNCTECHDPHRPMLATRWPARAGRLPGEARAQ